MTTMLNWVSWLKAHWLTILWWLIAAIMLLLLAVAAASRNALSERADSLEERIVELEGEVASHLESVLQGDSGADCSVNTCPACEHAAKQCKCGNDPLEKPYWCNRAQLCEIGCSSDTIDAAPPQPKQEAAGAMPGEGGGDPPRVAQRQSAGRHKAGDAGSTPDAGSHDHGPKCPCNVCPWNCLDDDAPVGATGDENTMQNDGFDPNAVAFSHVDDNYSAWTYEANTVTYYYGPGRLPGYEPFLMVTRTLPEIVSGATEGVIFRQSDIVALYDVLTHVEAVREHWQFGSGGKNSFTVSSYERPDDDTPYLLFTGLAVNPGIWLDIDGIVDFVAAIDAYIGS